MNKTICKNCQYYLQHYVISQNRFIRIYCGHCTHSKVKGMAPDKPGCAHFTPGAGDTEAFVTMEYLTKALLNRVFQLELLPEIKDSENYSTKLRNK